MDALKSNLQSHPTVVTSDDAHAREQARFITEHSTCAMCDSILDIRHESDRALLKVKEEAHCPSCGIRVRSVVYPMH